MNILITSSKGDNFVVHGVEAIRSASTKEFKSLIMRARSGNPPRISFDSILRDRDIEIVTVEGEDIGF